MKLLIKTINIILVVLISCACSDAPSLSYIHNDGVILAFGDSLTVGVGASKSNSYPNILAELTGRKVISAGISGEETKQGVIRLAKVLEEVQPDLLILLEGGNDILRSKNLNETKINLAAMIEMAQSKGVEVLLIGVPEKKLFSDVAPLYEELASEYEIAFMDDLLSSLLRKNKYKSDAVHLNEKGYQLMAESIHNLLVESGAL